MEASLEKKGYREKEFKTKVIQSLKKHPQGASLNQVVLDTGLSLDWVDYTLRQLIDDFPAHLEINEQKELVYQFDFSPPEAGFSQKIQQVVFAFLQGSWQVFVFVFKVWILLMLFTYLLFNTLVLAFGLAILTRNGSVAEGIFKVLGKVFKESFKMVFSKGGLNQGIIQQVFSYVFGPTKDLEEDRALEKRILAFIQLNQGRIKVAELIQLSGWSLRKAEEEAAHLMAQYQGDAEVSEEGVISYTFPAFAAMEKTAEGEKEDLKIWKNLIPLKALNGNNRETNQKITLVNGFNLLMAIISPFIIEFAVFEENEVMPDTMLFFTLVFPFCFSLIFYLVPLLRSPFVQYQNRKIENVNQGYRLIEHIFKALPQVIYPSKMAGQIKGVSAEELKAKLLDLNAEVHSDEEGQIYYALDRINRELAAQ